MTERSCVALALTLWISVAKAQTGSVCGIAEFNGIADVVYSPLYPEKYAGDIYCKYTIRVPSRWILITFEEFYVGGRMPKCEEAYLNVSVGCPSALSRPMRFCSANGSPPHPVVAKSGCAEISFESKGSFKGSVFAIQYQTFPGYAECPSVGLHCGVRTEPSGLIVSPGWPTGYHLSSTPTGDCTWLLKQPPSKIIMVNVMDVDLFSLSSDCSGFFDDRVEIKGLNSSVSSMIGSRTVLCKSHLAGPQAVFHELSVAMITSGTRQSKHRGFVLGYVTYDYEVHMPAASYAHRSGAVIGGVVGGVAALFFILLLVAAVCRRRRKHHRHQSGERYLPAVAYHVEGADQRVAFADPDDDSPNLQRRFYEPPPAYPGHSLVDYPPPEYTEACSSNSAAALSKDQTYVEESKEAKVEFVDLNSAH